MATDLLSSDAIRLLLTGDATNQNQTSCCPTLNTPSLSGSAASCLLPERIGQAQAEDLLFSGRSIDAEEALRIGLVTAVDVDPEEAVLDYFDQHLAPVSASTLRFAVRAARAEVAQRISAKIAAVEKMYVEELMSTHDAVEGLTAFIAKRPAEWQDR